MLPSNSVNCVFRERFAFGVFVILGSLCISNPPFHALLDRAGLEEEEEQVVAGTCQLFILEQILRFEDTLKIESSSGPFLPQNRFIWSWIESGEE